MSEEGGGLNHHEHHEAEKHKQERDEETIEAELRGVNPESNYGDVDESGKYSPQRLSCHHSSHVVGGELSRHPYQWR